LCIGIREFIALDKIKKRRVNSILKAFYRAKQWSFNANAERVWEFVPEKSKNILIVTTDTIKMSHWKFPHL
jgi:hypothetical protein